MAAARNAVIVAARRSPIAKFQGSLKDFSAPQIGAAVLKQCIKDVNLDVNAIDEVIVGQVLQATAGQNPGRQTSIHAGIPDTVPAYTINKVCGSGLKVIQLGMQSIMLGDADVVVCGGQESMTQAPHAVSGKTSRGGTKMGPLTLVDTMVSDGLTCAFNNYHMGITAENIAAKYNISRQEQDEFALASQTKAMAAQKANAWDAQLVQVGELKQDEYINKKASAEGLQKLKPAFKKDGTVTAGNASGLNDGAAFVIMMSQEKAKALNLPVLCTVKAFGAGALDPKIMGMGPVPATSKCLAKAGWKISDLDLIESNEAFAAQSLGVLKETGFPVDRVNVNGGAIALGHPIGASGTRLFVDLIYELKKRNQTKGLATMCIGGGQGVAVAIAREATSKM